MNKVMEFVADGIRYNGKFILNSTRLSVLILFGLISSYVLIIHYNLRDYLPVQDFKQFYVLLAIVFGLYVVNIAASTMRYFSLKHTINGIRRVSYLQISSYLKKTYEHFNYLCVRRRHIGLWTIVKQYHFLKAYCLSLKIKGERHYLIIEHELNQRLNFLFRKALRISIIDLIILNLIPLFMFVRLDIMLLVQESAFIQANYSVFFIAFILITCSTSLSLILLVYLYVQLNKQDLSISFIRRMFIVSNILNGFSIFRAAGSFATLLAIKRYEQLSKLTI